MTAKGSDLSAVIPGETALAGLGITAGEIQSINISIPAAESYGLPLTDIKELLDADKTGSNFLKNHLMALERQHSKSCRSGKAVALMVSEVYATRSLNVKMNFSESAALRIQAAANFPTSTKQDILVNAVGKWFDLPVGNSDSKKTETPSTNQGGKSSTAAEAPQQAAEPGKTTGENRTNPAGGGNQADTDKGTKDIAAALADLKNLSNTIDEINKIDLPYTGAAGKFYSTAVSGVTLDRRFANPAVIGYKGFEIQCEHSSGDQCCSLLFGPPPVTAGPTLQ